MLYGIQLHCGHTDVFIADFVILVHMRTQKLLCHILLISERPPESGVQVCQDLSSTILYFLYPWTGEFELYKLDSSNERGHYV